MKYDVIMADPPWEYKVYNAEKSDRHVSHKYPLMSTEDICNLPIADLAAENCALFIWATWPNILDAFKVIDAWKFKYRTEAWTWVKANRSGFGHFMGMGHYTRANTEPCLLAVKGKMPVAAHDVLGLIYSPVREHSRKPDLQYSKIDRLYPNTKRLELFARKKHPKWDSWGNEVPNDIEILKESA